MFWTVTSQTPHRGVNIHNFQEPALLNPGLTLNTQTLAVLIRHARTGMAITCVAHILNMLGHTLLHAYICFP